jgi:type IV pilus assembly protein PilW
MRIRTTPRSLRRTGGASLIEVMVGVTIGLIAVLVIYQVFATAEGFKRNTTGAGGAQQNGLFSSFTVALDLANGGNGTGSALMELANCNDTGDLATTMRPIPVAIADGGADANPDTLTVIAGDSDSMVSAIEIRNNAAVGTDLQVQSPSGFWFNPPSMPAPVVAVMSRFGAGATCFRRRVTAVSAPDATGVVNITTAAYPPGAPDPWPAALAAGDTPMILNLGPQPRRIRYDVVNETLRSTDLETPGAVPVPIASNIVNFKAQYGLDTDNDGAIDTWQTGTANFAPAALMAAPVARIGQIKAVRIGVVVRSEQFDRNQTLPFTWTLFDCGVGPCVPAALTGVLPANWRYRTYETVIPLRNSLYNPAS